MPKARSIAGGTSSRTGRLEEGERRAVLNRVSAFETHRWKSIGGPQSGKRSASSKLEPRPGVYAVTAFGQLSLGSLDDARGARSARSLGYETADGRGREGS